MNGLMLLIFGTDMILKLVLLGFLLYTLRKTQTVKAEPTEEPPRFVTAVVETAQSKGNPGLTKLEEDKLRFLHEQEKAFQQLMSYNQETAYGIAPIEERSVK